MGESISGTLACSKVTFWFRRERGQLLGTNVHGTSKGAIPCGPHRRGMRVGREFLAPGCRPRKRAKWGGQRTVSRREKESLSTESDRRHVTHRRRPAATDTLTSCTSPCPRRDKICGDSPRWCGCPFHEGRVPWEILSGKSSRTFKNY